jgi:serine/threonine-protein kinase ATR
MTAFPQIVSRIGHENNEVVELLLRLVTKVIEEYPHQALWLFMSVVKSKRPERERRGRQILEQIKVWWSLLCGSIEQKYL